MAPENRVTVQKTPSLESRLLGGELRRLRESAGLTTYQVAAELECTGSKVSRIENGWVGVRPGEMRTLLGIYQVEDEAKREQLLAFARESQRRRTHWWQSYTNVLTDTFRDYLKVEATAETIRNYELLYVPGLLQTEDYARAQVQAARRWKDQADVDQFVAARMERQRVLDREPRLSFHAVLGEGALRCMVGGVETMRGQLRHLLEAAERYSNVSLHVLPFSVGAQPGANSPFAVLTFPPPTAMDVVYLEGLASNLYIEDQGEIQRYVQAYTHLLGAASSSAETCKLIKRVLEEL